MLKHFRTTFPDTVKRVIGDHKGRALPLSIHFAGVPLNTPGGTPRQVFLAHMESIKDSLKSLGEFKLDFKNFDVCLTLLTNEDESLFHILPVIVDKGLLVIETIRHDFEVIDQFKLNRMRAIIPITNQTKDLESLTPDLQALIEMGQGSIYFCSQLLTRGSLTGTSFDEWPGPRYH